MGFRGGSIPIDIFDLKILGRPIEHLYTKKGALNLLPRVLSDLFHQCDADEEEFLNLLVPCLPVPTLLAIIHADYYGADESGNPDFNLRRYIFESNLDSLEIPFKEFKRAKIEDVRIPIKREDGLLGKTKSIIREGYRVSFSSTQEIPTDKELLEILKLWRDKSEVKQGDAVIKNIKEISVEGDQKKVIEEEQRYFIEEIGEDE